MSDGFEIAITAEDLDALNAAIVRRDPEAWLTGFGRIKVRDRAKGEDGLVWLKDIGLGWLQRRICEIVRWCLANKKPIRLLVYKKRQTGASTGTVGLLDWACHTFMMDALIIGGAHKQVKNLWEIYNTYARWDHCTWGHARDVLTTGATYHNGAGGTPGSRVVHESMAGKEPARSGTWTFLLGTEVARWAEEGVANASDVLTGILNGVPRSPLTFCVLETTVRGGSGAFFELWQDGVEFEDFQQGIEGNGWIRVFEPWYYGFDSQMPVTPQERADILAGRGAPNPEEAATERELMAKYKLTPEHIKFWRWAFYDCQKDADQRDRDFPTTPEHGFRASVPSRFNPRGLRVMTDEAAVATVHDRKYLLLEKQKGTTRRVYNPVIVADESDANFLLFERPEVGRRYVIAVDTMSGEEDKERKGKDKRDCHAIVVLRDGYMAGGRWHKPRVVACSKPECRIPIDGALSENVIRLSTYYGNCLVVPEANFDAGLIAILRKENVNVYEREKPSTDKDAGKKTGKFGFLTRGQEGEGTRGWIIEQLARAIRNYDEPGEGVEVFAEHIMDELRNFVTKDGKDQALSGKHDDHVMALAIAYNFKDVATQYHLPVEQQDTLPPELLALERQQARQNGGGSRTHRK